MRRNLVREDRRDFFLAALALAAEYAVKAIVVLEDTSRGQADTTAANAEDDVVRLFLERANNYLYPDGRGIVVADRPGGHGQEDEDRFLERCVAALRSGTRFVQLDRISLTLTTPSHNARLLQLADVVTGATTPGGEEQRTKSPAPSHAFSVRDSRRWLRGSPGSPSRP